MRVHRSHALQRNHRRKKNAFSKRQVRAIKSISQKPVETKHSTNSRSILNGTVSASIFSGGRTNAAVYLNVFDSVYRADSVGVSSRSEVIGQEFQLRGIKLKYMIYSATGPMKVRISLVSWDHYDNTGQDWNNLAGTSVFYNQEDQGNTMVVYQSFNTDAVKVHKSKSFTISGGGQSNLMRTGSLWVPMRRKCVMNVPENTSGTSQIVGPLKDKNFYWIVEFLNPAIFNGTSNNWLAESTVYFKDA